MSFARLTSYPKEYSSLSSQVVHYKKNKIQSESQDISVCIIITFALAFIELDRKCKLLFPSKVL